MSITVGVDSYVSLEEANNYFNSRLHAEAWVGATDTDKEKALKQATRNIDVLPFRGAKASDTQNLSFPRTYAVYKDGGLVLVTDQDIPQEVKNATCEEALSLLQNSQRKQLQEEGVDSITIGNLTEHYSGTYKSISLSAYKMLSKYIVGGVYIR